MTPIPVLILERTIVAVAVMVSPSYHHRRPEAPGGLGVAVVVRPDAEGDRSLGAAAASANLRPAAPACLNTPEAGYSLKMCAPSMPASALRVSTTSGARRATSA